MSMLIPMHMQLQCMARVLPCTSRPHRTPAWQTTIVVSNVSLIPGARLTVVHAAGHLAEELADVELDGDDASTSSSSSSGLSDEEGSEAGHSEPEDEVGPLSPSGPMEQKWRMATGGSAGTQP